MADLDPDSKVVSGDRWFGIAAKSLGDAVVDPPIAALREQLNQTRERQEIARRRTNASW